ncbi:E1B 21 kd protein [Murine adenovirus 1]|uniref:E1B protein, small T-antigen n=1 Tax=Murine adenovirus A serotype 1 TaxID=10530 RepID=E1BS_ADEM1|nr:E1B 21 kd protein [Murine mastadenovirus A]AP_000338.1 E1B 19K [Murine mastadenovirus A]P12535.1 RecName: Full=E1B protein, small T-antigen; AltName: Full=E1B 19 kDa protein; Short=E1B-19K [Murine adenovirus 1]AAA42428.1 E1B 21 kd protein [Murine adenovirus 1]
MLPVYPFLAPVFDTFESTRALFLEATLSLQEPWWFRLLSFFRSPRYTGLADVVRAIACEREADFTAITPSSLIEDIAEGRFVMLVGLMEYLRFDTAGQGIVSFAFLSYLIDRVTKQSPLAHFTVVEVVSLVVWRTVKLSRRRERRWVSQLSTLAEEDEDEEGTTLTTEAEQESSA